MTERQQRTVIGYLRLGIITLSSLLLSSRFLSCVKEARKHVIVMTLARPRRGSRHSPCRRHPDETLPGICASCIRERLSSLDAFGDKLGSTDLPRCRSVSIAQSDAPAATCGEPRRNSCDVVSGGGGRCGSGTSLSLLFNADDVKFSGSNSEATVETRNLGLSRGARTLIENGGGDGIRASRDALFERNAGIDEGEFKTMKEFIDLEFGKKNKKSKELTDIAGNFLEAACVFSKKLRNWRRKDKTYKHSNCSNANGKSIIEDADPNDTGKSVDLGRRSCDTEPRFSNDAGQIPFDEPRASWEGYMIARSIPRLAPMFSYVENGVLSGMSRFENHRLSIDRPMHSIMEDESSSGVSALGSGHSNSDSSSSLRRSSFDRSSSIRSFRKKLGNPDGANTRLVITERELNDWHLSANKNESLEKFGSLSRNTSVADNLNLPTPHNNRWHKVCNVLGFGHGSNEKKAQTFAQNAISPPSDDTGAKQGMEAGQDLNAASGWKLTRSRSVVDSKYPKEIMGSAYSRKSVDNVDGYKFKGRGDFMPEINGSPAPPSKDLNGGILPFYVSPLRSVRSSKSGKCKHHYSHSVAGNVFHLK